jgi:hypothetical protein
MTADQANAAALNGVQQDPNTGNPTTTPLSWRWVYVRARQIRSTLDKLPFAWPNPNAVGTVSTFDQVQGTAEQVATRFVDPVGNVINFFTVWVTDWLWKLDGAPTPLTNAKLAEYLQLANQINPWPEGYAGINTTTFPGEPVATYATWPSASGNVNLSAFLPSATNPKGTNAAGIIE